MRKVRTRFSGLREAGVFRFVQCAVIYVLMSFATGVAAQTRVPHAFMVRSYDGTRKCLDYRDVISPVGPAAGPGAALPSVFLNDCTKVHPIIVEELQNGRHEVVLHAGAKIIGIRSPTVGTPGAAPSASANSLGLLSPLLLSDHVFALDGDSIILASSRPCVSTDTVLCPPAPPELVVQVENARGANGTAIVLGPRRLIDPEFWDFLSTDGKHRDPTSGFVHVATAVDLWNAICATPSPIIGVGATVSTGPAAPCNQFAAGWGTVVVVDQAQDPEAFLWLAGYPALILPAGVTLRGDRRGVLLGPQLSMDLRIEREGPSAYSPAIAAPECPWCMIEAHGDYVRITGLRLKGQNATIVESANQTNALQIDYPPSSARQFESVTQYITNVDHNESYGWPASGFAVQGDAVELDTCTAAGNDQRTQGNARIFRNFLHNDMQANEGYGVVLAGGRADVDGNTFLMNRHAIAGNGDAHNQYTALYNIVLSDVPIYLNNEVNQDFDMHGFNSGGYGGVAGDRIEIAGNLFLGGNRWNFELRGHPCFVSSFHDNVTERTKSDRPINVYKPGPPSISVVNSGPDQPSYLVALYPVVRASNDNQVVLSARNQHPDTTPAFINPAIALRVGDFDGDGVQDLFIASGTAWYYAPAGQTEWRFLSAKSKRADDLLFGDFDGDGRTDVVALQDGTLVVSWGGVSDWEVLSLTPFTGQISDLQVGRFIGDSRDDLFWADGSTWRVSDHGAEPFVHSQTSSFRVRDLRFGDFNGDGRTDVLGIVSGKWQVSYGATSSWTPLPVSLTSSLDNVAVADFDGDGKADVILTGGPIWYLSSAGSKPWVSRNIQTTRGGCPSLPTVLPGVAIGHFEPAPAAAGVLVWQGQTVSAPNEGTRLIWGKSLCLVQGVLNDPIAWSRYPAR